MLLTKKRSALLNNDELVEGWAETDELWRKKLEDRFGEIAKDAFIYLYGQEPHQLSWKQVDELRKQGHSDRNIKLVFDHMKMI
jgi:hypothetical protein